MKITDVQAHLLAIPWKSAHLPASWVSKKLNILVVEINTDEGVTGYGESFAFYGSPHATAAVIRDVLKPILLGADPAHISFLQDQMYRQTHLFGRYGITTFAISGVDIALWDIAGKCAGLPLYRLLGGAKDTQVPAYASLPRYGEDRGRMKEAVLHAQQDGYDMIKLHQLDVESLEVARRAVGGTIRLMMDVNCSWSPEKALEMARRFAPYDLYWLEEPVWPPEDFQSLARLGDLGGIPIAAGENACTVYQFKAMLDAGAATYIQPSVIKVGGVSDWRKIALLAEAYNVKVAPHSPFFGPGLWATVHLVAATPCAEPLEYYFATLEASVFKEAPRMEKGLLSLPQGPGLGLEIDPSVFKHYRLVS